MDPSDDFLEHAIGRNATETSRQPAAADKTSDSAESVPGSDVCAPPTRDRLASKVDKAHVFSSLFGGAATTFKIDRFTVLSRIGGGAMGEVYAAYDERLDRKVALKLVRQHVDAPAALDEQLLREAKVMAQVSHRNVVQVYDAGRSEGKVYIAMEYVRGTTLRRWLDSVAHLGRRARIREVLRQFIAAGRGLQAAHEAGLVHRDFKPENVLVGKDGQPRVGDFGLARTMAGGTTSIGDRTSGVTRPRVEVSETDAATLPMDVSQQWALKAACFVTSTGRVVGTPRYMSPEQWRGERPHSRSDQFSFCVALWEALVGRPPFAGNSFAELMSATSSGAFDKSASAVDVPASVRKALQRGLSVSPDDRFPDMRALLAALEKSGRPPRWPLFALAGMATAAIGGLLYAIPAPVDPCADAGADMDNVWNAECQAAIRDVFGRSEVPGAGLIWDVLERQISSYADRWQRERIEACSATHTRHEQSDELLDRRVICLKRGWHRLTLLLDVLRDNTNPVAPSTVYGAVQAAAELPDLAICRDAESLRYGLDPPPAAKQAAVDEIRNGLRQARKEELRGHYDAALALAQNQRQAAEALAYEPVYAEVLFHVGRLLTYRGKREDVTQGENLVLRAVNLATGERHDELVVEALTFLMLSAYRNHDTAQRGYALSDRAFAASRRIGDLPRHRAALLRLTGLLLFKDSVYDQAEDKLRQALAVLAQDADAPWLFDGKYRHDLGNAVRAQGRFQEARQLYTDVRTRYAELGANHPYMASVQFDTAMMELQQGDLDAARTILRDVLSIRRLSLGENHPDVGKVYLWLAHIHGRTGALERAENAAAAALRIYEQAFANGDARLAKVYQELGAIRFRRQDYGSALVIYKRALQALTARFGRDHDEVGYAWANAAEAELLLGRHDDALASIDEARRILGELGPSDRLMSAFIDSITGQALLGTGQVRAALDVLERALEHFAQYRQGGAPLERAAVHWTMARALAALDGRKSRRARAQARMALGMLEHPGGRARAEVIRRWLGPERRAR